MEMTNSAQRTALLTAVTMISFAANSILARLALRQGEIDAGTFTAVRIVSAAVGLVLVLIFSGEKLSTLKRYGSWRAAAALFGYAAAFSFAYLSLDAGTGALILFAAVQIPRRWGSFPKLRSGQAGQARAAPDEPTGRSRSRLGWNHRSLTVAARIRTDPRHRKLAVATVLMRRERGGGNIS